MDLGWVEPFSRLLAIGCVPVLALPEHILEVESRHLFGIRILMGLLSEAAGAFRAEFPPPNSDLVLLVVC